MSRSGSFFLVAKEDDFTDVTPRTDCNQSAGIAYSTPANDNITTRNRLLARCESFLRRLINSHS
jgi:hypothetical protein